MGSSSSKAAGRAAAGATRRQYPSTSSLQHSNPAPPLSTPASQVRPDPRSAPPSETRSEHVELDARDPQFGAALRRIGPVKLVENELPGAGAFPTSSHPPIGQQGNNIFPSKNSASNASLLIVQAREQLGRRWDEERENLGRPSFAGRTLVSAKEIKDILNMRDQKGVDVTSIEKQLRLRTGIIATLGRHQVVANA